MLDQVGGDFRRRAKHQIDHPGWHASVGISAHELAAAGRSFLRAFDHYGAARSNSCRNLAHQLQHWKVPRGKRGDQSDWISLHGLRDVGRAASNGSSIDALGFTGEPVIAVRYPV